MCVKYYDEFRKNTFSQTDYEIYRTDGKNNANKLKKEFDPEKSRLLRKENKHHVLHRSKLPEKLWFNIISVS